MIHDDATLLQMKSCGRESEFPNILTKNDLVSTQGDKQIHVALGLFLFNVVLEKSVQLLGFYY